MPSQTKKITFDTAALFSGKIIGLLLGMVRLNYLSTYLGVANFGVLNFALYFCSLFQVLFDFGISQLLTRDLARDLSRSREVVGKALVLKVVVVFVAGLVVGTIGILSHFERMTNWAILLTTVVFAINGLSLVLLAAFQAHRKMTIVSLYNILNDVLLSVLVILLIASYPFVVTVLLFTIAVALANFVMLLVVYVRKVGLPRFAIDIHLWRDFLRASAPIAVSSVGISMYTFIGPTVLKYSRGNEEVGIFTAGYKLISILTLIPTAFTQVVFPIFSSFYSGAREKLQKALVDSLRVMELVSFPLAVGTIVLAPKVFAILYPPAFAPGVIVLQIMIGTIVLGYANWVLYSFLLAINRHVFGMMTSLSVASVVTVLSIAFVPIEGYVALPFIAIVSELLLFILETLFLHRIGYEILSFHLFAKPFVSSISMGAILVICLFWNLFLLVPLGAFVYALVLYLLRGFGEQEKELLRGIASRLSPIRG